jgi:hypothetical protein
MMGNGFAQYRPRDGGLPYAPLRDLVNTFAQIARRACYLLDPAARDEQFKRFLESNQVSDEDLSKSAECLARYINFCSTPDIKEPIEAINKSGFNELSESAQIAILSRVGQVLMAMYYICSRDAFQPQEKPLGYDQLVSELAEISTLIKGK